MSEGSRRRDRAWPWLALALIVLVGVVLRAIPLLRSGGLFSGIDTTTASTSRARRSWSAATSRTPSSRSCTRRHRASSWPRSGRSSSAGIPHRVVLGRWLMVVFAALTILLIADIGRRWRGWPTGLIAASLYAVSIGALIADATILLEPFLNLFCLAALDVWLAGAAPAHRLHCLVIGAPLMLALSVKLWAGVYVLVIGGVFLLRRSWRDLAWTSPAELNGGGAGPGPAVRPRGTERLPRTGRHVQAARPADLAGRPPSA